MATDERKPSDDPSLAGGESWAAVLAAVEADVRRAERLLATQAQANAGSATVGAPAEAMLPGTFRQFTEAAWTELPAFEDMPPVPAELTQRIHLLRAEIVALQAEIKTEMAQWRASCAARRPAPASTQSAQAESFFMDRLV
jgi:hypothetical protein